MARKMEASSTSDSANLADVEISSPSDKTAVGA
eukprot:CAMPEP_0176005414 /NCGR_PEP_ID=MMETSP0120_2-20121206/2194_1 /TAXON_ID=160619 /ORGANISM="Kryptoperidinium foliaceum, Strain CCMP 1326" /LENGTH=32 /DNA_ID= /DNA_START= /DNA_END= /DNA_ORIENTATION=